ncbi:MAG: hypothetical protein ACLTDR_06100 [Adlercreutzia equolifaciens]
MRAEGGLEIAGTRTSVGDVDGEEHGGRIVVASEGVTEGENKTKLAHASDFARVSTEQLVRPDAPLYGVAAYDWAHGGHGNGRGGFHSRRQRRRVGA